MAKKKRHYKKQNESDIGDVAEKLMDGISKTYKVGGVGLVLIAIGAFLLLCTMIFSSALNPMHIIIVTVVSLFLIFGGAKLLVKRERRKY
ncbi:MAG: hypothetical protein JW716_05110 [Candidatus Aenigmarchaeota archaeon]|nr:hypothetical protein [Candidatus Aenigmarchaeota archaeon]